MGRKLADVGVYADPSRFVRLLAKLVPSSVEQLAELLSSETEALLQGGTPWLGTRLSNMERDLAEGVFPGRARAWRDLFGDPQYYGTRSPLEAAAVERVRPVNATVESWADSFCIRSPFVLKVAAYTLMEWATWEARCGHRSKQQEFMVPVHLFCVGSDALAAKVEGRWDDTEWLPPPKSPGQVIARDRARLGRGFVATLRHRADSELKAFIRWQVQGWTLSAVSRELYIDQNQGRLPEARRRKDGALPTNSAHAVNKLMRAIAGELGITPRASRRGRPVHKRRGSNR